MHSRGCTKLGVMPAAEPPATNAVLRKPFWRQRRAAGLAGLLLLMLLLAAGTVAVLLPSNDELARRAEAELAEALGVNVALVALDWRLLPRPAIILREVATDQPAPVTAKALVLHPDLMLLMQKRIRFKEIRVQGAVVPQASLAGLGRKSAPDASGFRLDRLPLAKLVLEELSWVSRRGLAVTYAGEVLFDAGWRPRHALLRLPAAKDTTTFELQRHEDGDQWSLTSSIGGGTLNGQLRLDTTQNGLLRLAGKLKPQGIEVSRMLQAFNRRPLVAGKVSGQTLLSADGANLAELVRSLRTQTGFAMGASSLLRFDLDRAVKTLGREHAGHTPLNSLTGQLVTQNSASGMALAFTALKAESGALTATGSARLQNQRLQAEVAVDLVEGVVGVPLTISGPLANVVVSMPAGAVSGAVVGTAVLPGVGTAIGARIGAAIGGLGKAFGGTPAPPGKRPGSTAKPLQRISP
ncbi:MAG: hypothetical protein JWP47_2315 [Polaromonas sp.]|nr:hypothetical protein [Polaromonas sp.]